MQVWTQVALGSEAKGQRQALSAGVMASGALEVKMVSPSQVGDRTIAAVTRQTTQAGESVPPGCCWAETVVLLAARMRAKAEATVVVKCIFVLLFLVKGREGSWD
jgi:hypothetical protein